MIYKELFYTRFGGEVSFFQKVEDWGRKNVPGPLRPLFRAAVDWLHQLWINQKIKATMRSVDKQAKEIADNWVKEDEARMLGEAVRRAELEFPDAKVEVFRPQPVRHDAPKPPPAVLITKPPDPNSRVQQKLGFGELELRAPWYTPSTNPE